MKGPHACELCGRVVEEVTRHHLIPRARHGNRRAQRTFDREEFHHRTAWLCRPCHKQIHVLLTEKEMERTYNTLEALLQHPEVARFVAWLRDKPAGLKVTVRRRR